MRTDESGFLEGPEMDALRELRAGVDGPSDTQREAAWERMQGARSQDGPRRKGGGRPWILAAAAAVAAGVVAVGVGVALLGDDESVAPASSESTEATPTNANPTPFATGSVWQPEGAADQKVMDTYRQENIHLLRDGGVRIDIPGTLDWMAMSRALNAEGIPVRFWAVQGTKGEWDTAPAMPIGGDEGVGSEEDSGSVYPREKITAERVGGPGTALTSLTFDEIPTEPVDIQLTQ